MQPNAELLKYIQEQSGQGWSMEQIMPELLSFGWPEEEIQVALQWLRAQNASPQSSELPNPSFPSSETTPGPEAYISSSTMVNSEYPSLQPAEAPAQNNTDPTTSQEYVSSPQSATDVQVTAPTPAQPYGPYVAQYAPNQSASDSPSVPNQNLYQNAYAPQQPSPGGVPNTIPTAAQPPVGQQQPMAAPQSFIQTTQSTMLPNQNVVINPTVMPTNPILPAVTPDTAQPIQSIQPVQTMQPSQPSPSPAALPISMPFLNSFKAPQTNIQKIKRMLAVLFIAVAVIGAALLLWSIVSDSPESAFKKTVQKSLLTGSFEREYTTTSIGEGLVIHAKIKSDFNDPSKPKSTATIDATLEFGPESTIEAKYEMVAIEDTIWLRTTDIQTKLDSATVSSYQELSAGGNAESIITSLVGADRLNEWTAYTYSPSYVTTFGLTYSLVRFGFSVNSPLSEFPIANTNKHSTTATNLVLGSGMLSVNYDKVDSEKIDNVNYKVYKATYNSDAFEQTAKNLAELLDLSQRHRDAITEKDIHVTDGEVQLWVDPGTKLPYQIKAPRDGTDIIFSGYGSNYDIKPPLAN